MRNWSRALRHLIVVCLLLVPGIGLLTPVSALAINAFHPVTFNENDSLSDPVNTYQTLNAPADLTLFAALSPSFSDTGFTFTGWNTSANGSGTSYTDGELYSFSADLALYAQWTPVPTTTTTTTTTTTLTTVTTGSPPRSSPIDLVISFESDGATGVVSPFPFALGTSVVLPAAESLSNPGFTFAGWFTSSVGGQMLGQAGTTLTPSVSVTAFAQWTADPPATLSFSSNEGKGTVSEILGANGSVVTVSGSKGLERLGYVFTGWNTSANASGSSYAIGSLFTLSGATTLYAQWSKSSTATRETVLIGSVGPFLADSTLLTGVLRAQILAIADSMRTRKFIAVTLYGYDAGSGTPALHATLSTQRAIRVDEYLRTELLHMGIGRVTMTARGEGAIAGFTAVMFRRVEIFAN